MDQIEWLTKLDKKLFESAFDWKDIFPEQEEKEDANSTESNT